MPGDDVPETYREARHQGRVDEYREAQKPSKRDQIATDSFLREDIGPGKMLAAKEIKNPGRLKTISIRVRGVVGEGLRALVRLKRGNSGVETELELEEGVNSYSPDKMFVELEHSDFLTVELITKTEEVTPLKEVLTTITTLHD